MFVVITFSSSFDRSHIICLYVVSACGCQSGSLFLIGVPSSYYLSSLEPPLPRLPSYESVRKKDRQRQIHMMIADRFGIGGPIVTEVTHLAIVIIFSVGVTHYKYPGLSNQITFFK